MPLLCQQSVTFVLLLMISYPCSKPQTFNTAAVVPVGNLQVLNRDNTQYKRDKGRLTTTTERNGVPSSFPRRHKQQGKQGKLHNIREDKGKTGGPKTKATATEAVNKENQTKLSNGSKQRHY